MRPRQSEKYYDIKESPIPITGDSLFFGITSNAPKPVPKKMDKPDILWYH